MATLRQLTEAYVLASMPAASATNRAARVDELVSSGILYTDDGTNLSVKAGNAPGAAINTSTLPTRLTSGAYDLAALLRELVDRGVCPTLRLCDRESDGVTLEEIT